MPIRPDWTSSLPMKLRSTKQKNYVVLFGNFVGKDNKSRQNAMAQATPLYDIETFHQD